MILRVQKSLEINCQAFILTKCCCILPEKKLVDFLRKERSGALCAKGTFHSAEKRCFLHFSRTGLNLLLEDKEMKNQFFALYLL